MRFISLLLATQKCDVIFETAERVSLSMSTFERHFVLSSQQRKASFAQVRSSKWN